jgi:hypothetical protein
MSVGTMSTLDRSGDTKLSWDSDNVAEVEVARAAFDRLTGKGYSAFRIDDGEQGAQMRAFDSTAEQIILVPQLVGG